MQYLKRKYNLLIGERTAEQIKISIGSAYPLDQPITMEIKGRNLIEGVPKTTVTVGDAEIREALAECVATILNAIRVALDAHPAGAQCGHQRQGNRADRRRCVDQESRSAYSRGNGTPVSIAEDPLASVCLGTGKMFTDLSCSAVSRSSSAETY